MREEGLLTLSENEWEKARTRADVIRPLATNESVRRAAADEAAKQLGISRRHVYELLRRYKSGTGMVTDLAVQRSAGGKGKGRISTEAETIINEAIQRFYLSKRSNLRYARSPAEQIHNKPETDTIIASSGFMLRVIGMHSPTKKTHPDILKMLTNRSSSMRTPCSGGRTVVPVTHQYVALD